MKKVLHLVLKNNEVALEALMHLKQEGYNATIVSTESLRHVVEDAPAGRDFFGLRHLENHNLLESTLCLFVVEDNKLEVLKKSIRDLTENFSKTKGFMYTLPINDYEGNV